MAKRRVVLTGAAGYVGQRMFAALAERWDLVPIDVSPTTRDGRPVPGLVSPTSRPATAIGTTSTSAARTP
jgi:nucleoside-diphosphate-sugar epimerase